MTQSTTHVNTKRKKRPAETGTLVGVRLQPDLLAWVDAERSKIEPEPTRPEFIRRAMLLAVVLSRSVGSCKECSEPIGATDTRGLFQRFLRDEGALEWVCPNCGRKNSIPLAREGMLEW